MTTERKQQILDGARTGLALSLAALGVVQHFGLLVIFGALVLGAEPAMRFARSFQPKPG